MLRWLDPFDICIALPVGELVLGIAADVAVELGFHLGSRELALEESSERSVFEPESLHTLI